MGVPAPEEVIPTQRIGRGFGPLSLFEWTDKPLHPEDVSVQRLEGHASTLADVLAETYTDAVVIVHDGRIVYEQYSNGMAADTPHLLMSVTKSVVGSVAGILVEKGLLDPEALASQYVPEVEGPGTAAPLCATCWTCAPASGSARSTPTPPPRSG